MEIIPPQLDIIERGDARRGDCSVWFYRRSYVRRIKYGGRWGGLAMSRPWWTGAAGRTRELGDCVLGLCVLLLLRGVIRCSAAMSGTVQ